MSNSELMLQFLEDGDLIKAHEALKKALKEDSTELLAALGEELYQLGFISEAKEIFQKLLSQDPENGAYLLSLGELAIEEEEYDEAFQYFDQVKKDQEEYPAALLDQADLYQLLDIPEVAEVKLKEANELLPEEPLISFALGELYYSLNRFLEAASSYLALIMAGYTTMAQISLQERLGVSYAMSGKFEEAVTPLEKALEEGETEDRLFYLAYTYEQLKESEKSIELYERLEEKNPSYRTLYAHLGKLYQSQEELEKAETAFAKGLKENPYDVTLYLLASENSYRLHDGQKAVALLEEALTLGDHEEEVVLALGNLYLTEEKPESVIALYEEHPIDLPKANWDLGKAYYQVEDFDNAFKFYSQAYVNLKEEPEFMREYGLFLREEGHLKESYHLLNHYLHHEPLDLEIQSIVDSFDFEDL